MKTASRIDSLLVDPSLFTAPYDAGLTEGLLAAGVEPLWATRPLRKGDQQELPARYCDPFFYRRVEQADWIPGKLKAVAKGFAHALGLLVLLQRVRARRPDVVHFQWVVLPLLDVLAMALIRRWCPLVLTVHDTVPFNGERLSLLQNFGFDRPMRLADRLIVHTAAGRATLVERGIPDHKIHTIAHGPLRLQSPMPVRVPRADGKYELLMFGEIKPYKGVDLVVEALHLLPADVRAQTHVVIAGRPRMDLAPLHARIQALGLDGTVEWRPERQSNEQMATLFAQADCMLFPYRQIDASGVWFLTKSLGKWMIASRVGIFAEEMQQGRQGVLLPPGDVEALAHAITDAVRQRRAALPVAAGSEWATIGQATRAVYTSLLQHKATETYAEERP